MKIAILILIFLTSYQSGVATTYYFSNDGNDSNDGKSTLTAWCSLEKLSNTTRLFNSGDSLLFECGNVFEGQINISTSGLYVGAYGFGSRPIISGTIEIVDWVSYAKDIWKAECLNCTEPANLFIDGIVQAVGRYPNTGYRTISAVKQSENFITDSTLLFKDGYWDGAEIVVRSGRWTIDKLLIEEYHQKTFKTAHAASYLPQPGSGYFLQKHLSTLDKSGEWFYQSATNQIYLFLKMDTTPMPKKITLSVVEYGLSIVDAHNILIENLIFERQTQAGVIVKNSKNIHLQHIDILSSGKNGLEVINSENTCVENSLIANAYNNGVEWHNNKGGTFSYNTISKIGIQAGRGGNGDGTYIALRVTSDKIVDEGNLFDHNVIDSVGYIGIDFRTGNTRINNNSISNFCLLKDDGGGIYTWENTFGYNSIEGNTINNGIGCGEGTSNPSKRFASGIYIDDRSSHILIKNNKVSNCATAGVFLHNAKVITIISNRLVNNGVALSNKEKGQLYIKVDSLGKFGGDYNFQLYVALNEMIAVSDATYCAYFSADYRRHLQTLGTFTQNEFRALKVQQAIAEMNYSKGFCHAPSEFSLLEWQRESGYENGSVFKPSFSKDSSQIQSKNLINNGNLTEDTKGWKVWPDEIVMATEKRDDGTDRALKVIFPLGSTEALLYHEGFSLKKNVLYRLSFSAGSLKQSKLEFAPLMAHSPWLALGDYTCFSIGSSNKAFTYYFIAQRDCLEARINFKSTREFWIGNVSLQEICEAPKLRL